MRVNNYSVAFVVSLIQSMEKIAEARYYKEDLTASDLLMDLELIIEQARLTDKQAYILKAYWTDGYTQDEVAKTLGITQQMCEKHCRAIKKKIKKVLIRMGEITNDKE